MKSIDVMRCKLVKESDFEYDVTNTPESAAGVFRSFGMADAADEVFVIACLATDGSITGIHEISHGDLHSTIVHPREVYKRALLNNAASIILAHNHPSGNIDPSESDKAVTERLKAAGELLGVSVLDHIIIAREKHFSFQEAGVL